MEKKKYIILTLLAGGAAFGGYEVGNIVNYCVGGWSNDDRLDFETWLHKQGKFTYVAYRPTIIVGRFAKAGLRDPFGGSVIDLETYWRALSPIMVPFSNLSELDLGLVFGSDKDLSIASRQARLFEELLKMQEGLVKMVSASQEIIGTMKTFEQSQ